MKFRNLCLLGIFVFCLLIVMFCQTDEKYLRPAQTADEIDGLIMAHGAAVDLLTDEAKTNLVNTLIGFRDSVQNSFKSGSAENPDPGIGGLLEAKHVILEDITKNYKRAKNWGQFNRLMRVGKTNKANELGVGKDQIGLYIVFLHIYVTKIKEAREDDQGVPLNMIARVIFEYHIEQIGGPPSKNDAGDGSGEFEHRDICTWEPGG